MVRKGIILSLVTLLVFQSIGYYCFFLTQYGLHKARAKAAVEEAEEEQLTFLNFTDAEYQQLVWAGKHEFWHQGVLHDHKVTTRTADGGWQVLCMRDAYETRMLSHAGKLMQTDQEDEKRSSTGSPLWLTCLYFPQDPSVFHDITPETQVFPEFRIALKQAIQDIPAPPPRFC